MLNFDYYKIIGTEPTATQAQIKQAYHAKLKKYHPDKVEQTKENIAKYKLIRFAGDVLNNPIERKAYDVQKNIETNNFVSHKDSFNNFINLQKITPEDIDRKIEDMVLFRDTEENEYENPYKLNNNKQFNNLFDKIEKKTDDILAANDCDLSFLSNDISQYETVDMEHKIDNINIQDEPMDIENELTKIMNERKEQNNLFENLELSDYGTVMDDKYGISKQLGFIVGSDKYSNNQINSELLTTYKELTS